MVDANNIVRLTPQGLYCAAGDFYIDPWRPVPNAFITHAHGDHAHVGNGTYHAHVDSIPILQHRLGPSIQTTAHAYGVPVNIGNASVSLHPAGHILGSSQIRIEVDGCVWVVSGDYKRDPDPTCQPFEVVTCDTFITEATFALPIYRWQDAAIWSKDIFDWWQANKAAGKTSLLFCYALGKAQRVLAELAKFTDELVYTHGAVENLTQIYRQHGIKMLPTKQLNDDVTKQDIKGSFVIAPPSANQPAWLKRLGDYDAAFASGWMRVRGAKRRRGYDRGFVVSDHADWPSLINTIKATNAKRVLATHGETESIVRYLCEQGINAETLRTSFGAEELQ